MKRLAGIITGANRGIGRAVVSELAKRGTYGTLYASCRSMEKAEEAVSHL